MFPMIKLGLIGCTGKLGKEIMSYIKQSNSIILHNAITRQGNQFVGRDISSLIGGNNTGITITDSIKDALNCDVLVDCTNAETFMNNNLHQYEELQKPVVIATTGFSENDFMKINEVGKKLPILFSPNYSFGLYNFIDTVKHSVSNIDLETDVQIIEYHHNEKKDAPSGTAIIILNAILEANPKLVDKNIKINSIRAGSIVGEHRVLLSNCDDEQIELIHKVSSREAFSKGIVKSAVWLSLKKKGYFSIGDVVNDK
jgi:4-hydroxy-tetrahydrodipicolinate reductase